MKLIFIFLWIFFLSLFSFAARVGTLSVSDADLYKSDNFESDIITNIKKGESFLVSKKNYNGFYKIKLKSGQIGFVPDHEIEINGKPFEAKSYFEEEQSVDVANKKNKNSKADDLMAEENQDDEDDAFDINLHGITFQMINLHEETLGAVQVDDILAFGYKSLADTSYEIFAAFKTPKYYTEKPFDSTQAVNLWGAYGINNSIPISSSTALRYSGSIMTHYSKIKISTPIKSYDLQDLSVGFILEGAALLHFKKAAFELSLKYFFDRNNYAGFGLSLLF